MNHHKAYKFRLYPNHKQMELIHKTIGSVRFVFNHFLDKQKQQDRYWYITQEMVQNGQLPHNHWKGDYFKKYDAIKSLPKLKKHYSFLKEVDSIALQASVENVGEAYDRYYKKQTRSPRFKTKRNPVQSYTTKHTNGNIAIEGNRIKLPKLGWVRFAKSREVEGRILNATIRKNPSGKLFVSVVAEVEMVPLPKTNSEVGMDVGLSTFAVLTNGERIYHPKPSKTFEKQLAHAQRILSRRTVGSSNWHKQKRKVARIHERITNQRMDFLHKLSTKLVKNHDLIALESLDVSSMVKLPRMAKSIHDASLTEFRRMVSYKAKWYGKEVAEVSTWFPSSQLCSHCGYQNKEVKNLSVRQWQCPQCQQHNERDENASKNLLNEAKRLRSA